ncbi:hypothetical protein A0H81_11161 [Grifola frondosa]|uniref:DUF5745 domain-containing protein n=1 Tax=Grifola frondosa TaxID=5627 RepID=A0A1C7LVV7_GRIFR|nr:hypothetical protein A0H81_11161 [Grifola frondosa]
MTSVRNVMNSKPQVDLVDSLNDLLVKLHIPIPLESPLDLTPSLLLAILESILQYRLPISPEIRASRDFGSKVDAMKIFLGVLANDVLRMDIGISTVDPRRLAAGEEDEVVFVGELLCWLSKATGILPDAAQEAHDPARGGEPQGALVRPTSPSTHSTITDTVNSDLSMMRGGPADTDTTVMSVASGSLVPLPDLSLYSTATVPEADSRPRRPRCIHEVEEPSFALHPDHTFNHDHSSSYCECSLNDEDPASVPTSPPPIRYAGCIREVDFDTEIEGARGSHRGKHPRWRVSRTACAPNHPTTPQEPSCDGPKRIITRHNSPTQYTLALLNERARLLAELASLKGASDIS